MLLCDFTGIVHGNREVQIDGGSIVVGLKKLNMLTSSSALWSMLKRFSTHMELLSDSL